MKINVLFFVLFSIVLQFGCSATFGDLLAQSPYEDVPFVQEFSIKYNYQETTKEGKVFCDRNGIVQALSGEALLTTRNGRFLYPGSLVSDVSNRTFFEKNLLGINIYQHQFVYIDDEAILSNAWAGRLFSKHTLEGARMLVGGLDFSFLISNGSALQLIRDSELLWESTILNESILDINYSEKNDLFWILTDKSVYSLSPTTLELLRKTVGEKFTAFELLTSEPSLVVGTQKGYFKMDVNTGNIVGEWQRDLPSDQLTCIKEINGNLWFGSTKGAFMLGQNGAFNYYHGERWLPGSHVNHISEGMDGAVLVLTDAGLGVIHKKKMTLYDKATFYDKQVRSRHIRNGFNATLSGMKKGDLTTGFLSDSDNDGLWTSMYLAGEAFRYVVTNSEEVLQNCRESFDAMERLYDINPVPGFPSRSFERSGYMKHLADPDRWHAAEDPEWDWKGTTSSDEAIGHIFAFGVIAELIDDQMLKERAIHLIDQLMQHIVDHDFYLVDYDDKPTTWGRWNPKYVNARPKIVGDRKINSSNIIGMLQTAYYFTKKEIYKEKAFELMHEHGYLENLMRPFSEIGPAPDEADDWSKMLSEEWNHSDDEMYFVGYWGLYRYAFNDTLKAMYKEAIIDHWEIERPEKEGLWNIMTALTGTDEFDLTEAVWYLREYPLDLIGWATENSHRGDINIIANNFRGQTTTKVLPPDETRIARHNANRFTLDSGGQGGHENSAGDIWLLPYWMGRYLGVISGPIDD